MAMASPSRKPPLRLPRYWRSACRELAIRDPVLANWIDRCPPYATTTAGDAFSTLARAIVGQQISVHAARSIWQRLQQLPRTFVPAEVSTLPVNILREAGLSARKAEYLLDLATRMADGRLEPRCWPRLPDEKLIDELTQVKGIGRWTAEMFLIFFLARPDVFPLDDLGLQRAINRNYNRGRTMSGSRMARLGGTWMPWRTVATWYLWRSLEVTAGPEQE